MKASIKKAWIEALRSEKYIQGREVLCSQDREQRTPPKYCCLGVVADIGLDAYWYYDSECEAWHLEGSTHSWWDNGSLSIRELRKLGLTPDHQNKLQAINDSGMYDFDQIADWIEENIPVC
jgi:hypothetical protein